MTTTIAKLQKKLNTARNLKRMATEAKKIKEATVNLRCCICLRPAIKQCGECLANDQLGAFCERHEGRHRIERTHLALWEEIPQ